MDSHKDRFFYANDWTVQHLHVARLEILIPSSWQPNYDKLSLSKACPQVLERDNQSGSITICFSYDGIKKYLPSVTPRNGNISYMKCFIAHSLAKGRKSGLQQEDSLKRHGRNGTGNLWTSYIFTYCLVYIYIYTYWILSWLVMHIQIQPSPDAI